MVGCSQNVLDNPPSIGSVITVKHIGHLQNGVMRHVFYWRERKDIPSNLFPQKQTLFDRANWLNPSNRREFFEAIGKELGFKSLDDFYKLSMDDIIHRGGKALLSIHFDGSIFSATKSTFP